MSFTVSSPPAATMRAARSLAVVGTKAVSNSARGEETRPQQSRKPHGGTALPPGPKPRHEARVLRLFDFDVVDTTLSTAAAWLVTQAQARISTRVAFVNAHCINVSYRDATYRRALASADCLLADGSGMAIAARAHATELSDNVNGTDLFPVLCARAAAAGVGIFLLGGQDGIAERAGTRMQREYPDLNICGSNHGYIRDAEAEARVIDAINASGAQILLVGLGVPMQDVWLQRNRHRLAPSVIIGVGGLFDYYSDRIPRAPAALRAVGLEWCWRLAIEPRRLARRYLLGNIEFLSRLARLRLAAAIQPAVPTDDAADAARPVHALRAA